MTRITETIKNYEYLTAGRYYTTQQKHAIFHLVACANFLSGEEERKLAEVLFSPDMEEYESETDCSNGLLMASIVPDKEYVKDILKSRKETLTGLAQKRQYSSKESWLLYLHNAKNLSAALFERAVHSYSIDERQSALEDFAKLAESCHAMSLKFAAAICRRTGDSRREIRYLIMYSRIAETLMYESLPAEFESRINALWKTVPEEVIELAYDAPITYFDEDELGKHIGFDSDGR